jgi:UDP-N-acetylmuramoyl-L-alanyl-D-glutamate--2,6-diaminopimelate ligase
MAACGVEIAVLEFSSYQLLHHAAAGMDLLAVAIINFALRHIGNGEHASQADYRAAKERLFACGAPFSVLPVGALFDGCGRVLTFGEGGQFFARDVAHGVDAARGFVTRFLLCEQEASVPVTLPLLGEIHLENALVCAALARVVGLTLSQIATGLSAVQVPGRMECAYFDRGRAVYLDSAFSPEDLQVALEALGTRCEGRLCVLLGSVGERAHYRRAPLGRVASAYADFVYLTADDPDTEDPTSICREMQAGMQEPARSVILPDRRKAILRAVREMRPGDVLLIAGKGAIGDQLIAGKREPFCERELVAMAAQDH